MQQHIIRNHLSSSHDRVVTHLIVEHARGNIDEVALRPELREVRNHPEGPCDGIGLEEVCVEGADRALGAVGPGAGAHHHDVPAQQLTAQSVP